ncbi:MAG TPA: TolC family protein [Phycisphaerales bacterium]|nr:TolC family protein [Phycisphaerales bacterium]
MKILILIPAVVIVMAMPLHAAESLDPNFPVTLTDYVRAAMANNAGLQSRFSEYKAALAQVPQARALDDPMFTYGYFIEEVETRVGPQKHRLGLMQRFPWFGKIEARTDAAAAAARAAGRRFEAARLEVISKTKAAYFEFAYLAQAVEIAENNLELLKHLEQVAQARYRTAAASHPDIVRAQIELAMFEDEYLTLKRKKKPVVAMVNAVLNQPPEMDLPWPKQEALPTEELDEAQVIALLVDANPELSAMSFEIAAARSRAELAQKRYWPDVTLGIDWIQTDSSRMPNTPGSGRDPVIAMVTLNLPLWTDSYSAGVQQAQSQAMKTLQTKTQMQSDLASQASELMFAAEDSRRKVRLYQDVLIPKAKEMLEVSEQAYRTGAIDFLTLIDAQRKLLTFELTFERTLANHLKSLARLEALVGGQLPAAPEKE